MICCVPCKIIINEMFRQTAGQADTVSSLLRAGIPSVDEDADNELYEMAACEVEAILAMRKRVAEFAQKHATSDRWRDLIAKVL